MSLAAFVGWQEARLWGHKYSFAKYLQELGLLEKDVPSPIERQQKKNQALARAAKIIELDKRRRW